MTVKKTILVIGSTGQQGGSVARYLLNDGTFNVRCMVRNTDSPKVKELLEKGAQVVKGDLNSVESLTNAMVGCYGVFGVTNFWDSDCGYDKEILHGQNIGHACKNNHIEHLVFSTLDRHSDVSHFESKVMAEDYIRKLNVPTTFLVTSFYFENYMSFFPPKPDENGDLVFTVAQKATTKVPMFACHDTGGWVLEIFKHHNKFVGKDVAAVGEYISYPEIVDTFNRVNKTNARFQELPLDVFRSFGFPGVHELAANLQFFDDISDGVKEDRRKINGCMHCTFKGETWEEFLVRTGWQG